LSNYTAFTSFFIKEKRKENHQQNKSTFSILLVLTDQIKSHDVNRKRNSDKGIKMQTF